MKLRFKITETGVVKAVPDSCTPGEEHWVTLFDLTDKQLRQLENFQNLVNRVESDLKNHLAI